VHASPFFITSLSDGDGGFAADSLMLLKKNILDTGDSARFARFPNFFSYFQEYSATSSEAM
jgi:hypothetical protein